MRSFCFAFGNAWHEVASVDYRFDKHFTLEQANALIPAVQKVFAHVHALLRSDSVSRSNGTAKTNGNGNGNGSTAHHNLGDAAHQKNSDQLGYERLPVEHRAQAAQSLLHGLEAEGIVIQDLTRGLIDFPAIRDGREVFLCYELSDGDRIQFYHDLTAGYAGRTPL